MHRSASSSASSSSSSFGHATRDHKSLQHSVTLPTTHDSENYSTHLFDSTPQPSIAICNTCPDMYVKQVIKLRGKLLLWLLLLLLFFWPISTKPQAWILRKSNNGCSFGRHGVLKRDSIPLLKSYRQALEQKCGFPGVFGDVIIVAGLFWAISITEVHKHETRELQTDRRRISLINRTRTRCTYILIFNLPHLSQMKLKFKSQWGSRNGQMV